MAFDLVGTLIDGEIFGEARRQVRVEIDFNRGWAEAETATGFNCHFNYEVVFRYALSNTSVKPLYRQFQEFLITNMLAYIFEDVSPTMRELSAHNIKLGFVTDGAEEVEGQMIRALLDHVGIAEDTCIVITTDRIGAGKTSGLPFKELISRAAELGIDSSEIKFVGDKWEKDVAPAINEGLTALLIDRDPDGSRDPGTIASLTDLFSLLANRHNAN